VRHGAKRVGSLPGVDDADAVRMTTATTTSCAIARAKRSGRPTAQGMIALIGVLLLVAGLSVPRLRADLSQMGGTRR
jgi:hypothetical protein